MVKEQEDGGIEVMHVSEKLLWRVSLDFLEAINHSKVCFRRYVSNSKLSINQIQSEILKKRISVKLGNTKKDVQQSWQKTALCDMWRGNGSCKGICLLRSGGKCRAEP